MKKYLVIIGLIAASFVIGCLASLENYPKEQCVALPDDNVVKAIHDNCIKCHTKDFTTKQDICVRRNRIIDAVSKGRMPKIGKLYDYYKAAIVNWR